MVNLKGAKCMQHKITAYQAQSLENLLVVVFHVKSIVAWQYINFKHYSRDALDEVSSRLDNLRLSVASNDDFHKCCQMHFPKLPASRNPERHTESMRFRCAWEWVQSSHTFGQQALSLFFVIQVRWSWRIQTAKPAEKSRKWFNEIISQQTDWPATASTENSDMQIVWSYMASVMWP